jgi:hypothetical protein
MNPPYLDKKTFNKKVGKYKLYDTKKNKIIEQKYVPHDDVGLLNQHYKSFKLNKEWRSQ